jgi:hypothetical protein
MRVGIYEEGIGEMVMCSATYELGITATSSELADDVICLQNSRDTHSAQMLACVS